MTTASYQTRTSTSAAWEAIGGTMAVFVAMSRAGFHQSELQGHRADLDAGRVLTAENGTEFRATPALGSARGVLAAVDSASANLADADMLNRFYAHLVGGLSCHVDPDDMAACVAAAETFARR